MSAGDNVSEGDTFECQQCGMTIVVTRPCQCADGGPEFSCCGEALKAVDTARVQEAES